MEIPYIFIDLRALTGKTRTGSTNGSGHGFTDHQCYAGMGYGDPLWNRYGGHSVGHYLYPPEHVLAWQTTQLPR